MVTMNTNLTPFSALTPDIILNALDGIGLHGDGRLLALNSYENRVYQVGMADGSFIVTKFYRPERWTSAAILEEHSFVQELFESEIPVVPAMPFGKSDLNPRRWFPLFGIPKTRRTCAGT